MNKLDMIAKLMELYQICEDRNWYDLSAKLNVKIKLLIDEL